MRAGPEGSHLVEDPGPRTAASIAATSIFVMVIMVIERALGGPEQIR